MRAVSVTTLAGSTIGSEGGIGSQAQFSNCCGISFNILDNCLYVCDRGSSLILKVQKSGQVTTVAKLPEIQGKSQQPYGIVHYIKENCFFITAWASNIILRMSSTGEITTFAGNGKEGYQNGLAANAEFCRPSDIAINQQNGDVFICDAQHAIRKITQQGEVSTLAGIPEKYGLIDGDKQNALFYFPSGICFSDHHQALFVSDSGNCRIRKVQLNGTVSSINNCLLYIPRFLTTLTNGNILVSNSGDEDYKYNDIHQITFKGGERGDKDGKPKECSFDNPSGLAVDESTNTCFVADTDNHKIHAIKYDTVE